MSVNPSFSDLLQQKSFIRMWCARLLGTAGMQMLMVAVGWQMYELTGSAWDLGLVGLYQFAPALLLMLVAGHVADRVHRGRIVAACLLLQVLVALVLVLSTHEAWVSRSLLLGLSVVLGMVRAFQMPAQQALTPLLVPPAMLPRAMAFSSAGTQATIIGGPALGGLIFVAGAGAVYASCAVLFAAGSVLVFFVRYVHVSAPKAPVTLDSLLAGVRFIWERKPVLGAVSLDLFAVLLGGAVALLPMLAKDILLTGPWGLGLLRSAPAVGALLMSLWLARFSVDRKVGRVMFTAVGVFGVATIAFGLSTSFWFSLAVLVVLGAADMISMVIRASFVQLETPDEMRGRVSAVNGLFIGASNQLGEFESGITAHWFGTVPAVVMGGVGTLVVTGVWIKLFPTLANRDRMHVPVEETRV